MAESCVKEIKLPNPTLESFIREVESKHGEMLTLSELYARDQKLGNEIILGVVDSVFPVIKKRDRQMQVIHLSEVTIECHRGQLFKMCVFNKFATSLADACLHKGDFAAFCSPRICESPQYRNEEGFHHLVACIGFPGQPSSKIFFARKPHITNAGTSKQQGSQTICKSLGVSLERRETANKVSRGTSPSSTETSCNSTLISAVPPILSNTARMSPVPPSILPCTSSSRDKQTQHALDDSAVVLPNTRNKYTYKKISDLVEPEKKVNIYGVIHAILKMPREDNKHAIMVLRDETCGPDKNFRVHIFFSFETASPKLEHGYILRLHRLKTELFEGVLDGRVFHATDVVTFPPDGQGIANAFATSKCFNFTDSDVERLTELRKWIASQKQQQPLPSVPVTSSTTLVSPVLSSEPNRTLLGEIKQEGNYILLCKVLDVNILSDEIRFFTVTDGTSFIHCIHLDEDERFATHEVRIMVLNPSPMLKKIRRGFLVELTDVTLKLHFTTLPLGAWLYLTLKVNGNNCNVKIFKGCESEAVKLKRRVQRSCEGGGSSDSKAVTCTDEDMECHSAELHSSIIGCKQKIASGIISGAQGIPLNILQVKRMRVQNGKQQVYLLKAWVKDIEPSITRGSEMNIVSGFCGKCKSTESYEALKIRRKNDVLCQHCFQKGQKIPVILEYLLRLHLIDKYGEELVVTVAGNSGVELLGCTVNAYLYESMANRRVVKILTDLIAKSSGVPIQYRGPKLKLMVTPVCTSMGTEYLVHSTYLCTTHNSVEQRN